MRMHLAHHTEKWTGFSAPHKFRIEHRTDPKVHPHFRSGAPARELHVTAFMEHDLKCSQVVTPTYGASLRQCSRIDFQGCLGNAFVRQDRTGLLN